MISVFIRDTKKRDTVKREGQIKVESGIGCSHKPRNPRANRRWEKKPRRIFPWCLQRKCGPAEPQFQTLAPRTVKHTHFIVFWYCWEDNGHTFSKKKKKKWKASNHRSRKLKETTSKLEKQKQTLDELYSNIQNQILGENLEGRQKKKTHYMWWIKSKNYRRILT